MAWKSGGAHSDALEAEVVGIATNLVDIQVGRIIESRTKLKSNLLDFIVARITTFSFGLPPAALRIRQSSRA
jgi:hypothetical protein